MLSAIRRIERLEERLAPHGLMLQGWDVLPDGRAFTQHEGRTLEQQPGEDLGDCLERFAQAITRRPLVFVSPLDRAL